MEVLTVGKPYSVRVPAGNVFQYMGQTLSLIVGFPDPTPDEVRSVRKGPMHLRIIATDRAALIMFRFMPGISWNEAYFQWTRRPPSMDVSVPNEDDPHTLQIVMVDARTNIVKALRLIGMYPDTCKEINKAIRLQALREPLATREEGDRWVNSMQRMTPQQLASFAEGKTDGTLGTTPFMRIAVDFKKN